MGADHPAGAGAQPAEGRRPFLVEALQAEAELRRDLATCLQLGVSPHRYTGWEPQTRTRVLYDEEGRVRELLTSREPEWDEVDRTLIDAYLNWKADLHTCGRPLSESLLDPESDQPDPDYQIGVEACRACMALDRHQAEHAKDDTKLREAGRNPDTWRMTTVVPLAELDPATQEAILRSRRRPADPQPT